MSNRLHIQTMKPGSKKQQIKERARTLYDFLFAVCQKWSSDKVPRLSAAVSFYAVLSLAPFLIIGTVILVNFIGMDPAGHVSLIGQARQTLGEQAAILLQDVVTKARERHSASVVASLFSFIIMFFSASNLFLQFDDAIRSIWNVRLSGPLVRLIIRIRLTAFASVIVFGAGIISWLYLDSRMAYLAREASGLRVGRAVSFFSTLIVLSFACIFSMKRLASVKLVWSDVLPGALTAAIAMSIAKYVLVLYFASSGIGNVYGPAGALVVILLWIYYCAQIYFFGVEMVWVCANRREQSLTEPAA